MRSAWALVCLVSVSSVATVAAAQEAAALARIAVVGDAGLSLQVATHVRGTHEPRLSAPCVAPCTLEAAPGVHELRVQRPGQSMVTLPAIRLAAGDVRMRLVYESHEATRATLTVTSIALGVVAIVLGVLACVPQQAPAQNVEGGLSLGISTVSIILASLIGVAEDSVRAERI